MANQHLEAVDTGPPVDPDARPLCLFDLDGVLTDPIPGIISCHRSALESVDLDLDALLSTQPELDVSELVRSAPDEVYSTLGVVAAAADDALAHYRERRPFAGLEDDMYDGVRDLLSSLTEAGWNLGVATNQLEPLAQRILDRLGIAPFFTVIVGSDIARTRSSKAKVLSHLLANLDHKPRGIAVIGDRATDIDAAKAQQMTAIGAAWGFGSIEELMGANADAVAMTPGDVTELLLGD